MFNCRSAFVLSICLFGGVCFPSKSPAQDEDADRPKIGLVLGGGGVRGAAHVSVLKMLEELRIPVDAIAGVSIGAIIGGFHAAGLPADEIESVITSLDWSDMFSDELRRPDFSFRRKEDDMGYLIDFDVGISLRGIELPRGMVQGHKIHSLFRRVTLPVFDRKHFDDLPIPFRAVATDLVTGKMVVLEEGDLATAIRASMSVPAVFTPVQWEDYLLVDGGVSSNLPVSVMREMGVDIIIAVNVEYPLNSAKALDSALAVTDQMFIIFVGGKTRAEKDLLNERDILITPNIAGISSSEFPLTAKVIELASQSIEPLRGKLSALSISPEAYREYKNRFAAHRNKKLTVEFIEIRDDSVVSPDFIRAAMKTPEGKALDTEILRDDISRIYGLGLFESVNANLIAQDGKAGLLIDAKRKSWGPNYLNFGIGLENDFDGGSTYNLAGRYTRTEINSKAAEWRTDVQIGVNPVFASEFFQPLNAGSPFFVAPLFRIEADRLDIFENGERIAEFRLGVREAGFDLGRELGNWGEVRFGMRRGSGYARLRTGDPANPSLADEDFNTGYYFMRFSYDRLDNVLFPQSGTRLRLESEFSTPDIGADETFEQHRFSLFSATSIAKHTLATQVALGTTRDEDASNLQDVFRAGGFLRLSGLRAQELTGRQLGIVSAIYYRRFDLGEASVLSMPLYAGFSLEKGNVWQSEAEVSMDNTITAGSVFIGMETFLGPLYFAAGLTENDESALYFSLGRNF